MAYKIAGECNQCGKCCLSVFKGGKMRENPCIDEGEDCCKFYSEKPVGEKYGHCLIYAGGLRHIKRAKDRFGKRINAAQIDYFMDNCVPYPKAEHIKYNPKFCAGCGFNIVEV